MATKPSQTTGWCSTGTSVEPDSGKKAAGWVNEERVPFDWLNWLFKTIEGWLLYVKDLAASQIANDSSVIGSTVKDALNNIASAISSISFVASTVGNDSSVTGTTVKDALNNLKNASGAASNISNDSSVTGSTVKDALNNVQRVTSSGNFNMSVDSKTLPCYYIVYSDGTVLLGWTETGSLTASTQHIATGTMPAAIIPSSGNRNGFCLFVGSGNFKHGHANIDYNGLGIIFDSEANTDLISDGQFLYKK